MFLLIKMFTYFTENVQATNMQIGVTKSMENIWKSEIEQWELQNGQKPKIFDGNI